MRRLGTLVALALLASGCLAGTKRIIAEQAAFDTKCPVEKVTVVELDKMQQNARVQACGTTYRYQDITPPLSKEGPSWVQQHAVLEQLE